MTAYFLIGLPFGELYSFHITTIMRTITYPTDKIILIAQMVIT